MCKCATCGSKKVALYDDRAELYFCDEQCFDEWAEDAGAETVIDFYKNLNITEVTI